MLEFWKIRKIAEIGSQTMWAFTLKKVVFTSIYSVVYGFLAFDLGGAGHGTIFFLIPLLTWPLLVIAVFFVSPTMRRRSWLSFVVLMTIHSMSTIFLVMGYLWGGDDGRLSLTFKATPFYCLLAIFWYLGGQILMWTKCRSFYFPSRSKLP